MRFLSVLFVLLPLCAHAQLAPDPEVGVVETHVDLVYYEVQGETLQALAASLSERGPRQGGRRFFGLTEWEVNAEYRWVEQPTGCGVEDLVVRVAITTHLPRRRSSGRAAPHSDAAWERFVRDLDAHEAGHRTLAAEAGNAIRWQLVTLNRPTCQTMKREAERAIAEILNTYEARNREYDRRTGHGRTQGAVWPPSHPRRHP